MVSQSTDVFEDYYQPHRLQHDLASITFGTELTQADADIFALLNNATSERDPHAPIYITADDVIECDKRKDIQELQRQIRDTSGDKSVLWGKISWIRRSWDTLKIQERRENYFKEVSKLRQQGLPCSHLQDRDRCNPRRVQYEEQNRRAARLGRVLSDPDSQQDITPGYVSYLNNEDTSLLLTALGEDIKPPSTNAYAGRCLFPHCRRSTFTRKAALTRHVRDVHSQDFKTPFPCPECGRLGKGEHMILHRQAWSAHVARAHGKDNAPNIPPLAVRCLICNRNKSASRFMTHFKIHEQMFKRPFHCPECYRKTGGFEVMVCNKADWDRHAAEFHTESMQAYGGNPEVKEERQRSPAELARLEKRRQLDALRKEKRKSRARGTGS